MSPHIKRTAIGGLVVGVTSLLVLSAIAVAHRDSRNMDADTVSASPDYASQSVQPVAIPPGMINPDSQARRFPHVDLPTEVDETASTVRGTEYTLPGNFAPKDGQEINVDVAAVPPASMFTSRRQPESAARSNPLRSESYTPVADSETDSDEAESATATESVPQLSLPQVSTAQYELNETESSDSLANGYEQGQESNESDVVTVGGYDLPSSAAQPAQAPLAVPPLPAFGNTASLPPDLNGPAEPLKTESGSTSGTATLLPPTASPAVAPPALPPSLPATASTNTSTQLSAPPAPLSARTSPVSASLNNGPSLPPGNPPSLSSSSPLPADPFGAQSAVSAPVPQPVSNGLSNGVDPRSGVPSNFRQPNNDVPYPSLDAPKLSESNSQRDFNDSPNLAPIQSSTVPRTSLSSLSTDQNLSQFVSDQPGERGLEGMQAPNLQIMKDAPQEIQVGHPATFTILVKNVGKVAAHDVIVQDALPQGTTLHASNPKAEMVDDTHMQWKLGTMAAGAQQVLTVEAIPQQEGEIGSVATVQFKAQASVRTVVTQPKLVVTQQADPSVLIGEQCRVRITITNEGTGVAYDVKVQEDVPDGFSHPQGDLLGLSLNDLAPGQTRTFDLELEATEPGIRQNTIRVIASNTEPVSSDANIEIIAPQLSVRADGPSLRYLERQATYTVSISNMGTATARNIQLTAHLPRGLRFSSAGNQGSYSPDQHTVVWMLEELAANGEAKTDLVVVPVEEGDFVLRFQSRADRSTSQPFEKQVRVDGQSELSFSVEDDNDPIELDGQTTYLVRLNNIGTRRDTNIQVAVDLPANATLVSMAAPVEYQVRQNSIVFSPIPAMDPKDEKLFRFAVALNNEGTQMVRVNVKSDLRPVAVVKEESTQVYSDQ